MKKILILLASFVILLSVFGCGSDFDKLNASEEGLLIEQLLPTDTWLVVSITTKDADQREAFEMFTSRFSEGEESFWAQVEVGFENMGMNYEEDVKPIVGEDGFRLVLAYTEDGGSFVGMTVADEVKAQDWLDAMVLIGDAEEMTMGDVDMYVTEDNGVESYTMLLSDILFVGSTSADLVNAKGQLMASDAENLLDNEQYTSSIDELVEPYVGYIYADFDGYEDVTGQEFGMGSVIGMGSYLMDSQIWSLSFGEDCVYVNGYGEGDREIIDDLDLGFDDIEGDGVYLAEIIPAADLVFYNESGNLLGLLELWIAKNGGSYKEVAASVDNFTTTYLGLDFEEEMSAFLDKGYGFAFHDGGGTSVPGLSVIVDVSSDLENAGEMITMLNSQVESLVLMMQYDETGAWDSLVKTDTTILGGDFYVVSVNTDALGTALDAYAPNAEGTFSLTYGITEDGYLIISTWDEWELSGEVLGVDEFADLKSFDETVFYLDLSAVSNYMELMQNQAASVMTGSGVVAAEKSQFEVILEELDAAMFGVKANRYEVWTQGVIK